MCFYVDKRYPDKKIADKDITCYKRLLPYNGKKYKFKSPYQRYKYNLNILFESKIGKIENYAYCAEINKGLHSYSTKTRAIECSKQFGCNTEIILKGIIPKGSEYYYNPMNRQYVSNQLILTKILN